MLFVNTASVIFKVELHFDIHRTVHRDIFL